MILTYKECIEKYGSDYQIKKEMKAGKLFKKKKDTTLYKKVVVK